MSIAAAHIIDRRGQWQILVVGAFDGTQKGPKVRQVTQLEIQKVFFGHDIMIALFKKR
jgi:hypothetical protein